MTYAQHGLIEATDIDGFLISNVNNLNGMWAVGSGNSGYGQTAVTSVSVGDIVANGPWNLLVTNIAKSAAHQGTAITAITAPVSGNLIQFFSALSTNLNAVIAGRNNAALQGATVTTSATYGSTWLAALNYTITVTFTNHAAARYFFNAGGQLGISHSHPVGAGINGLINDICNEAGTVWCSSPTSGTVTLAGTAYNGITKVGGGYPAGTTTNTNYGFYNWTTTSTQISKQFGDFPFNTAFGAYTANTNRAITVYYNGAGIVIFVVTFDEVPDGALVSAGTTTNLIVRPPSSAQITNTWGTPTVSIIMSGS